MTRRAEVAPTRRARRYGILVRISEARLDDETGEMDEKGVKRQEKDCRVLVKHLDGEVVKVYVENDTSAFKRRKVQLPDGSVGLRVVRPAFREALQDAQSGAIDGLVGYDLDRVARDPRDLEDLIDVREMYDVDVKSVTGSLRLDSDADITMARVMVAVANKSSRDTARRVSRKNLELAEEGKFKGGGHRPFGYEKDGVTVRDDEAKLIREMARKVLKEGCTLNGLAKWLNEQGVPTIRGTRHPSGRPVGWQQRSVHSVLTKPRNAGLRTYRGEVIGDAEWPAILDRATWEQVMAVLDSRARGATNKLWYWLTGTLKCALCTGNLRGSRATPAGRYWCDTTRGGCGKIAISAKVHDTAEALVVGYLSRPDNLATLREATSTATGELLRSEIHDDETQLRELAEAYAKRDITMKEYLAARRIIEQRLTERKKIARTLLPASVRELLKADDIGAAFAKLEPVQKREVARVVFPDGITVKPARMAARRFQPERNQPVGWPEADGATLPA